MEVLEKINVLIKQYGNGSPNENTSGVYAIVNPSGQVYVGSSNNVYKRFRAHKWISKTGNKSKGKLYRSMSKYGIENHHFIVILNCEIKFLYKLEREVGIILSVLDRRKGLNCMLPNDGEKKLEMCLETRAKIGAFHKGKKLSPEHVARISALHKGKKQSFEHIEKRKVAGARNGMYGKPSPNRGKKYDSETLKRMSERMKGKGILGENGNAKKVIDNETGRIYTSAKEVAIFFKIKYGTLTSWLRGVNKSNGRFSYVNDSRKVE